MFAGINWVIHFQVNVLDAERVVDDPKGNELPGRLTQTALVGHVLPVERFEDLNSSSAFIISFYVFCFLFYSGSCGSATSGSNAVF